MTRIIQEPDIWKIYNEFDRVGLLLGLPRLLAEKNADYKRRLFDVFINRANSSYRGLINGITRELGLEIIEAIRVRPAVDDDGAIVLSNPAVVFSNTKCILYNDYVEADVLIELDRFDLDSDSYTLQGLVDSINNTNLYTAELLPLADGQKRAMTIFNQSSVVIVPNEDISGAGVRIVLENRNLISGTVSVRSDSLTRRVDSSEGLRFPGDYYISLVDGTIYSTSAPSPGSFIRYHYRVDDLKALASPIILHNLQSDDFKSKMFDQLIGDDGEASNGRPTNLGADVINELLSIYPTLYAE